MLARSFGLLSVALASLLGVTAITHAQPANDLCTMAQPVAVPSGTPGTTVNATLDPNVPTCTTNFNAPGVWYTLVGTGGLISVDVCTASYDTKLFVFCTTGAACIAPSALTCVGGNDDSSECSDPSHSRLRFCSASGQTYFILVSGIAGSTGTFLLNVESAGACANPIICAVQGSCCSTSGLCSRTTQAACTGPWAAGGVCSPSPCVGACCNTATGSCSSTLAANCVGVFQGLGTVCSPNPCGGACCGSAGTCSITGPTGCAGTFLGLGVACAPLPCVGPNDPANSLCANAEVYSGTGFTADGTTLQASTDLSPALCVPSSRDVWYAFTPSVSGEYSMSLCRSLVGWNSVLSLHSDCPTLSASNLIPGACNDDGCATGSRLSALSGVPLIAGTRYLIRVAGSGTGGNNAGPFTLDVGEVTGACCDPMTGACVTTPARDCATPNTWLARAVCEPSGCDVLRGACCGLSTGLCSLVFAGDCPAGSSFVGVGTTCTPASPCTQPVGACCSPSGLCQVLALPQCVFPATFQGAATACVPNVCPTGPANDLCASASPASVGLNTGTTLGASSDGVSSCAPAGGADVFFRFVAPDAGTFQVDLCSTVPAWDSVISVHSDCPASTSNLLASSACDDDSCGSVAGLSRISQISLDVLETCYIRVATYSATEIGGPFVLSITPVGRGACCYPGEPCFLTVDSLCLGTFLGVDTVCSPDPCAPVGACCNPNSGACALLTASACATFASPSGDYRGDGVACSPSPCEPTGACCAAGSGCCIISTQTGCPGVWTIGASCGPQSCAAPANDTPAGAVALALGVAVSSANCNATNAGDGPASTCQSIASRGVWFSFVSPVTARYSITTCGSDQDTVLSVFTSDLSTELACDDDGCDAASSGSPFAASVSVLRLTAGTTVLIRVSSYGFAAAGGPFQLLVTPAPASGACCRGATCSTKLQSECIGTYTRFTADGELCNASGNTQSPCCKADFNQDGSRTIDDIYLFIFAWFQRDPGASVGTSGLGDPVIDDVFVFINIWFAGC